MNNIKDAYNNIASRWSEKRSEARVSDLVIEFAKRIKAGGNVLDIGCGSGVPLARYLSENDFSVTGIDSSDQMIRMARDLNLKQSEFIATDFFDFESTRQYDGILAWDSLWHFPRDKQESIYPKVAGLLKPHAHFLFTHGNIEGEHIDTMLGEEIYYSSLSLSAVHKLLSANGLSIKFSYENFVEGDSHRALVVLAQKNGDRVSG